MKLNFYLSPQSDTCPLVLLVHGGGTFWVQVQVGTGVCQIGSLRNYLLTVDGTPWRAAQGVEEDTNVEVARLQNWPAVRVTELIKALQAAGCEPVQQPDGASVMILVPDAKRAQAAPVLEKFGVK